MTGQRQRERSSAPTPRPFHVAGIYIPEIMNALDKRGTLPLKGAAIGDGCWCVWPPQKG